MGRGLHRPENGHRLLATDRLETADDAEAVTPVRRNAEATFAFHLIRGSATPARSFSP